MIAAERLRLGRAETRLTPGCLDRVLRVSRERLAGVDARRSRALFIAVERRSDRFHAVAARLRPDPLIRRVAEARSRTADLATRAGRCAAALVGRRRDAFERLARVFDAVNYHAVLDRGFALVRDADGKPLKRTADVAPAMALEIEFADGRVSAVAAGDPDRAVRRPSRRAPSAGQGDLF
jgi:exodeoxyribonuclease VII large subunit